MTFDMYQELGGEVARRAYLEETGDAEGPPNDYIAKNQNPELRTVPVANSVEVWLRPNDEHYPLTERRGTFDELPEYFAEQARILGGPPVPDEQIAFGRQLLSGSHFLLTVAHGEIVRMCEGYYP